MNEVDDLRTLAGMAAVSHPFATYYSVANQKVSDEVLSGLRKDIVALASQLGYPDSSTSSGRREFDQQAGEILDGKAIDLIPSEAANQEVWNFLTLCVLPDVAKWRYPNTKKEPDYERWLGRERNVFRKLWWRQVVLGSELTSKLGEDEAVGIMERPNLGGNAPLARAMARATILIAEEYPDLPRSEIARHSSVLVRGQYPLIDFAGIPEKELDHLMMNLYRKGAQNLRALTEGTGE